MVVTWIGEHITNSKQIFSILKIGNVVCASVYEYDFEMCTYFEIIKLCGKTKSGEYIYRGIMKNPYLNRRGEEEEQKMIRDGLKPLINGCTRVFTSKQIYEIPDIFYENKNLRKYIKIPPTKIQRSSYRSYSELDNDNDSGSDSDFKEVKVINGDMNKAILKIIEIENI
jgi:hypothetical protein